VEFLHRGHDIRHVFDDVDGQQAVEGIVSKGVRRAVEIAKDVGAGGGILVDPDGSRLLVNPATDVQCSRFSRVGGVWHSSRVPNAMPHYSRANDQAGEELPAITPFRCIMV
jgi:hypothetical protein